MSHTSIVIKDKETYKKFKQIVLGQGKDVSTVLWEYIEETVSKYDGIKPTLDDYCIDPNYVPKPELLAPINKVAAFLLRMSDPELEKARIWTHQMLVYCIFFQRASSSKKRQLIQENDIVRYDYAWNFVTSQGLI